MIGVSRWICGSIAATVLLLPVLAASAAQADGNVPFTDKAVNGSITLCDAQRRPVTSGDIRTAPFAWTAVSSVAAPEGYYKPMGKATLYAFQPREKVDPGEWTGTQLSGSSTYSNLKFPMAQSTKGDPALKDFLQIAPLWQGLVELRMFFSNYDMQPVTRVYPAAVIKVEGNKWHLVSGGGGSCTVGTAVSSETLLLPPSMTGATPAATTKPSTAPVPGASSTAGSGVGATGSAGQEQTDGAAAAVAGTDGAAVAGQEATNTAASSGNSSTPWLLVLGVPLIGLLAAGAFWFKNRKPASAPSDAPESGRHRVKSSS